MKYLLPVFLLLAACADENSAPQPITEIPETPVTEASSDPEAVNSAEPSAEPSAETTPTDETEEPAQAPSGPLNLEATVNGDGSRGLTFGGVYRLAGAIGLPQPTLHGRPTEVGEGKYVVLVSFEEAQELAEFEIANLRPEIWLITTNAEGAIRREGFLPVGHVPAMDYLAISVGEATERATELFQVKAVRAADLDGDGATEFEFVVEVDDEVVCGPGLLTHRYYMIYNTEPALALAADIGLAEASGSGAYTRATTRLTDHNSDGHRDILLRTKECTEGSYVEGEGCTAEATVNTYYLWDEATDVWQLDESSRSPCGEP